MNGVNRTRCGKARRDGKRFNRRIPVLKVARDKPSLQTIVASPGWREMSLSGRVIAITLFALARADAGNSVKISRKELSALVGVTDPATLAKANRDVQAIGLFQIVRGYKTKYSSRPTVYRLAWWSEVFQRWLKVGYALAEIASPTGTGTTKHPGTSTGGRFALPTASADGPPSAARNGLPDVPASAEVNDLQQSGQAV